MGHCRLERGEKMVVFLKFVGIVPDIVGQCGGIPEAVAVDSAGSAREVELRGLLVAGIVLHITCLDGAFDVLTDEERTTGSIVSPPLYKAFIVGRRMSDFPIYLRNGVIHPSLVDPEEDIGIEIVVILQTTGVASGNIATVLHVVVYAEGRDTELHPRLGGVDRLVDALDEGVDIISPPFINVAETVGIFRKGLLVGDGESSHGIGIEIVVDMNAIDIVTRHDVLHDHADVAVIDLKSGVEDV